MIKQIELSGSYYEIGLKLGEILKKESGYPPKYSKEVIEKSHAYEEQVKIFAPGLLDECKGIADALGVEPSIPITFETSPYRFQMSSCFTMAISGEHTKNGSPLLARNHEWMERDSENLRVCTVKPDGKLRSMGFTFHWPLVSRYGGMNEAGLALSSNTATFENTGPGIMVQVATRWILDTCETTQEAVAYLEEMPKVVGETYIIIDKENVIAKVESHRENTKVTYSATGFEWNSLLYDSDEMQPTMSQERIDSCIDYVSARRAFLDEWFPQNRGSLTNDLIIDALKSHEHKMCYHGLEGLEICWSYILEIGAANALVCQGRPCKNEFVEVKAP